MYKELTNEIADLQYFFSRVKHKEPEHPAISVRARTAAIGTKSSRFPMSSSILSPRVYQWILLFTKILSMSPLLARDSAGRLRQFISSCRRPTGLRSACSNEPRNLAEV